MIKYNFIIILLILACNKDEKQLYKAQYKKIEKNAITIKGHLLEYSLGGTCSAERSAGLFIFNKVKSNKIDANKSIAVVIQCARSLHPKDFFKKNEEYELVITKERFGSWMDVHIAEFDSLYSEKYYGLSMEKIPK